MYTKKLIAGLAVFCLSSGSVLAAEEMQVAQYQQSKELLQRQTNKGDLWRDAQKRRDLMSIRYNKQFELRQLDSVRKEIGTGSAYRKVASAQVEYVLGKASGEKIGAYARGVKLYQDEKLAVMPDKRVAEKRAVVERFEPIKAADKGFFVSQSGKISKTTGLISRVAYPQEQKAFGLNKGDRATLDRLVFKHNGEGIKSTKFNVGGLNLRSSFKAPELNFQIKTFKAVDFPILQQMKKK